MASSEDPAAVLEQFMHDAANLPAEICHMMEEIQAKDREMQKCLSAINAKDGSLQKHLKLSGSLSVHPKEKEYSDAILKNYDLSQEIQDQKIALSDKACVLLDRQVKLLDMKIRELQNDGQLLDGPPIPSIFNRKSAHPDSSRGFFAEVNPPANQPLQTTSGNAAAGSLHPNLTAHRLNSQHHLSPSIPAAASSRLSQLSVSATSHLHPRNSAPATPASSAHQLQQQASSQRQRESSAGAIEHKKRRLNLGALPAQSSTLRQSSLGPGTPKAGTPTAGAGRAGSAGPRSAVGQSAAAKKSASLVKKMVPHHQQISKLKGKPSKRMAGTKRKGMSPSVRSRTVAGDEEDSVLSSAEPSDTDASTTTRSRRGGGGTGVTATLSGARTSTITTNTTTTIKSAADSDDEGDGDVDMAEAEEVEEEEQEDDRKYCFCQRVSFGEMVGCENDKCPYEWFHLGCVGLKEAPKDQDVWYCPECRPKFTGASRK
jgi:inhibitor of growth protein 3